jgi:hypothetical protein
MKARGGIIIKGLAFLGLFLGLGSDPLFARTSPNNLTLVYTNNVWGEIDPCPV